MIGFLIAGSFQIIKTITMQITGQNISLLIFPYQTMVEGIIAAYIGWSIHRINKGGLGKSLSAGVLYSIIIQASELLFTIIILIIKMESIRMILHPIVFGMILTLLVFRVVLYGFIAFLAGLTDRICRRWYLHGFDGT